MANHLFGIYSKTLCFMPVDDDKTKIKNPTAKDFYYILGVSPNASTEQVHEAYAELNDKVGPYSEAANNDPETQQRSWRDIKAAYETLSEPAKRREYDKNSSVFRQTTDVRALWTKVTSGVQNVVRQEQTQELKAVSGKIQAQSLEMELDISLKEAVKGCRRQITIQDPKACEECINLKPVNRMQWRWLLYSGAHLRHRTAPRTLRRAGNS